MATKTDTRQQAKERSERAFTTMRAAEAKGLDEMAAASIARRLEYLRGEIEAERISMSEVAELQSLAEYIEPSDVVLLEWAGVPEFPEEESDCGSCGSILGLELADDGDLYHEPDEDCRAVRIAHKPKGADNDDLEALAARFERNAADWRAIGGNPDLAAARGLGFSSGMAEAWRLAAEEVRRVLRRDPDYYDLDDEERLVAASQTLDDMIGLPRDVLDSVEAKRKTLKDG
jgi:hypothetical protein